MKKLAALICVLVSCIACNDTEEAMAIYPGEPSANALFDACKGRKEYEPCDDNDHWDGACVDGWCHCFADSQCFAKGKFDACVMGLCAAPTDNQ